MALETKPLVDYMKGCHLLGKIKINFHNIFLKIYFNINRKYYFYMSKSDSNSKKVLISIKPNNSEHGFVNKDKSYVIIGSATNLWIKTVNWLLQQDAKKLIFVFSGTTSEVRRSQRTICSLVQKYNDVSFIMSSAERFNTINEGEVLLREFTSYSKIGAIFCIEMVC